MSHQKNSFVSVQMERIICSISEERLGTTEKDSIFTFHIWDQQPETRMFVDSWFSLDVSVKTWQSINLVPPLINSQHSCTLGSLQSFLGQHSNPETVNICSWCDIRSRTASIADHISSALSAAEDAVKEVGVYICDSYGIMSALPCVRVTV